MTSRNLIDFFDNTAEKRDRWISRNAYYHNTIAAFMRFHIPPGKAVLEIGCGTGFLLNALSPGKGVGIDVSEGMIRIASNNYPHLRFIKGDALDCELEDIFDYIVISDTIGYFEDIQGVLKNLRHTCTPKTRIIISSIISKYFIVLY